MNHDPAPEPGDGLADWWRNHAESELAMLLPKAGEYSAYDLEVIGSTMADVIGWTGPRDRAAMTEIGIAFYVIGKVGRIAGALKEGRLPSDDTWLDTAVYAKMVLRTRHSGGWPSGRSGEEGSG